jgi:hypothetical protein
MQQLGKPADEILTELKSALECNALISDGLVDLLENLQRDNSKADEKLLSGVWQCLRNPSTVHLARVSMKGHGSASPSSPLHCANPIAMRW